MPTIEHPKNDETTTTVAEAMPAPALQVRPGRTKVSTRFVTNAKDSDLAAAIARILAAMTGNPDYPAPVPTLETLTEAGHAFEAARLANDGGRADVARRDRAREHAEDVVRRLAAYVQHACEGDKVRLLGSGFAPQRERGASPPPTVATPTGLVVRCAHASGQVLVRCKAVPAALLYEWRFAPADTPDAWTYSNTTARVSRVLAGLASCTRYVLQVRALGARGKSDWSEGVTLVVA